MGECHRWRTHPAVSLRRYRLVAVVLAAAAETGAQTRSLLDDVGQLKIRQRTEHYALAGTVPEARLAEYGRALEYVYAEYARGFEGLLAAPVPGRNPESGSNNPDQGTPARPPPSTDRRCVVVVLDTPAQYEEFTRAYFADRAEHTRGLFVAAAGLLVIRDEESAQETYEILFHEAFHQFVDRYVPLAPVWLNEGLATYYGTARPTQSGLVFDRPRTDFFRLVSAAADARSLVPFEELIKADAETFYARGAVEGIAADRAALHYAQSYTLLVHLLKDPQGREHLRGYVRKLAGARNAEEARRITAELFPAGLLAAMVNDWLAMVRRS